MSTGERHERCAQSLGAYALGALAPDECAEVEDHVSGCEACQADLGGLELAVAALAGSATPLHAPDALKARIMAVVEGEAELLAASGAGGAAASRRPRGWGRLVQRPAVALGVAAVALVVAVATGVTLVREERATERVLIARITDPATSGVAQASVRVSGNRARLVVEGLPDPPARRVYQVWVKAPAGPPVPAGATFAVRSGTIEIPRRLRDGEAVLVTHEPAGGSPAPTRPPLIVSAPA